MSLVHERMVAVFADVKALGKERSHGVSYSFRSVDAAFNYLHPIIARHGLFTSPRVLDDWQVDLIAGNPGNTGNPRQQTRALFRVCVDVYAEDGTTVALGPGLCQSHDYGDKAVYQAQQNGLKYVLIEAFQIPTEELDMDAREADPVPSVPLLTNEQKAELDDLAEQLPESSERRQKYQAARNSWPSTRYEDLRDGMGSEVETLKAESQPQPEGDASGEPF